MALTPISLRLCTEAGEPLMHHKVFQVFPAGQEMLALPGLTFQRIPENRVTI